MLNHQANKSALKPNQKKGKEKKANKKKKNQYK